MTLTHPAIESMRDERDIEHPTVTVSALDTHVVEDGDDMPAEHHRKYPADCFCLDGRHRAIDHEQVEFENSYVREGAHRITVHLYAVTIEEIETVSPRKDKKVPILADDPTLPTVAESEARIRDGVAKIRSRTASARVARAEADRIEALRVAKRDGKK